MGRLETIKMVDGIPTCEIGHKMVISSYAEKGYQSGFICNICNETYSTPHRWFCEVCFTTRYGERDQYGEEYSGEDICLKCVPVEDMINKMDPLRLQSPNLTRKLPQLQINLTPLRLNSEKLIRMIPQPKILLKRLIQERKKGTNTGKGNTTKRSTRIKFKNSKFYGPDWVD